MANDKHLSPKVRLEYHVVDSNTPHLLKIIITEWYLIYRTTVITSCLWSFPTIKN